MTNKKVAVSIAYVSVLLQLVAYLAHDTGRLSDGRLYWTILYASSIALLVAVLWLARIRLRSRRSQEAR